MSYPILSECPLIPCTIQPDYDQHYSLAPPTTADMYPTTSSITFATSPITFATSPITYATTPITTTHYTNLLPPTPTNPIDIPLPHNPPHTSLPPPLFNSWKPHNPFEKPPFSYATLIAHAILSSEQKRLPLSDIYQWISTFYPYYSLSDHGWQNSIRHNLSLNKAFVKLERSSKKGCYWSIQSGKEQLFIDKLMKRSNLSGAQSLGGNRTASFRRLSREGNLDQQSLNSPLFTTFRTHRPTPAKETSKSSKRKSACITNYSDRRLSSLSEESDLRDSDCDSGVDIGATQPFIKKRRHQPLQLDISSVTMTSAMSHFDQLAPFTASPTCSMTHSIFPIYTPTPSTMLSFDSLSLGEPGIGQWPGLVPPSSCTWRQDQILEEELAKVDHSDSTCLYGVGAATNELLRSLDWK